MAKKKKSKIAKRGARKPIAGAVAASDFQGAFEGLRRILQPHAEKMFVKEDGPQGYYLETISASWKCQRMFFGAVRMGKSYVSFHLMPLYTSPELLRGMSPELKRHMQGKSCFNFTGRDTKLFGELARLTRAGYQKFKADKYL
jgi:hypothetical protein